jgi:5'-deoxynucleotidase YfbR-like HD superfamily hydrolase
MTCSDLLSLLLHGNQLKRTTRTGWGQRGITNAESVAAHSFGTTFIALMLAEVIEEPLDVQAVLTMAILHDLPEALTSDIPAPAWKLMPANVKPDVEESIMRMMLGELSFKHHLLAHWDQLEQNDTAEARLVHECDKLDMYLQALMYEEQTGNRQLVEFWEKEPEFTFVETRALYEELSNLRQRE